MLLRGGKMYVILLCAWMLTSFINSLPRSLATLDAIMSTSLGKREQMKLIGILDVRVLRVVVFKVLQWLTVNNEYYYNDINNHKTPGVLATS